MTAWTLHSGDCLGEFTGLSTLGDMSVDVTISDPPYDDHTHKSGRRGHRGVALNRGLALSDCRDLGFAAIRPEQMQATAIQLARVTRRWIAVFCTLEMVGDSAKDNGRGWRACLERAGVEYVRTCVWHKLGSTPQFTGDRPAQAVEAIVLAHRKGRKRWNGGGKHGYYKHAIVLNRGDCATRCHTTQKPLDLMLELVADFTEPGDLVLDPYAGSGTTGVACNMLGRRFVGWEFDAEYHAIATRRLAGDEAKPRHEQPSLFDAVQGGAQ